MTNPLWVGDSIYYLGDRTGSFNLYAHHVPTRTTEQLTAHNDFGIRWYDASARSIVYAHGGRLYTFDAQQNESREIAFTIGAQIMRDVSADSPAFDRSGRYLYYIGSNNAALAGANNIWGLLSAIQAGPLITKTINAVTLHADQPAPFLPVTNRPHPQAHFDVPRSEPIDFDGIETRTIQLPLSERNYVNRASYNWRTGQWAENDGVHPDVEVEWWPADWMAGRDPQLERAVEIALEAAKAVGDDEIRMPARAIHPR